MKANKIHQFTVCIFLNTLFVPDKAASWRMYHGRITRHSLQNAVYSKVRCTLKYSEADGNDGELSVSSHRSPVYAARGATGVCKALHRLPCFSHRIFLDVTDAEIPGKVKSLFAATHFATMSNLNAFVVDEYIDLKSFHFVVLGPTMKRGYLITLINNYHLLFRMASKSCSEVRAGLAYNGRLGSTPNLQPGCKSCHLHAVCRLRFSCSMKK